MDITPVIAQGRQIITGYGAGGFKINGEHKEGSLILFHDRAIAWNVQDTITLADLQPIIEADPATELLLIGTGNSLKPIHPDVKQALKFRNIAVDVMDTGAACRTFNIVISEERRAAALLMAV